MTTFGNNSFIIKRVEDFHDSTQLYHDIIDRTKRERRKNGTLVERNPIE